MSSSTNAVSDCQYCGQHHPKTVCHLVRAIEYHANGKIKRVEFKEPTQQWVMPHVFGNPPGV